MIRCDYCGSDLPSVKHRAHIPTVPYLQRLGFDRDKIVCPECVQAGHVAKAMYEAPAPDEPDAPKTPWPPKHPDDLAWWISRAQVAINTTKGEP